MSEKTLPTAPEVVETTETIVTENKQEKPSINDSVEPDITTKDKPIETSETTSEPIDPQPPLPKRPLSAREEAKKLLTEAFPQIDQRTIEAILIASNFHSERSFNSLLYLSDVENSLPFDDFPIDQESNSSSARPIRDATTEQDELLAKQLDREFNRRERRREREREHERHSNNGAAPRRQQRQSDEFINGDEDDDDDVFTNFVEKDLPQIKEQFNKNLEETKNKFSNWVNNFKTQYNAPNQNSLSKTNSSNKFDDDPEELDLQKFHGIKLNNNEFDEVEEKRPSLPNRNRSGSTDLYGTPKTNQSKSYTKPILKEEEEEDDFLLSDDDVKK